MPDDLQNTWVDSYDDDCQSYFDGGFCTSDGQFGPYYEQFAAEMVHYGIVPDASFLLEEGFDEFAQGGYNAANCKACGCVEPTTTTAAPTTTTTAHPCVTCSSEPKGKRGYPTILLSLKASGSEKDPDTGCNEFKALGA